MAYTSYEGKQVEIDSPHSTYAGFKGIVKTDTYDEALVEVDAGFFGNFTSWYKKEYLILLDEKETSSKVKTTPIKTLDTNEPESDERKVYTLYHCYSNFDGVVSIEDLVENYDGSTIYGTREEFNEELMEEYNPNATYRVLIDNRMFNVRLSLILHEV